MDKLPNILVAIAVIIGVALLFSLINECYKFIVKLAFVLKYEKNYKSNSLYSALTYSVSLAYQENPPISYRSNFLNDPIDKKSLIIPFIISSDSNNTLPDFLLVLGESGSGKTTFIVNLAYQFMTKSPFESKAIIFQFRNPKLIEKIQAIHNKRTKILLLDGLEEDYEYWSNRERKITELIKVGSEFRSVVITCQTQAYPDQIFSTQKSNPFGSLAKLDIYTVYLSLFDKNDVYKYLSKRYNRLNPDYKKRQTLPEKIATSLPNLPVTPQLFYILEQSFRNIPKPEFRSKFYRYVIEESISILASGRKTDKLIALKEIIIKFLLETARQILLNFCETSSMTLTQSQLIKIEKSFNVNHDLKQNLFLSLNSRGEYCFTYKSFLEYFIAIEMLNDFSFSQKVDTKIFEESKLFLQEMDTITKKELFRKDLLPITDVFGISSKIIASYYERPEIDTKFTESIKQDKHIIIYGSSKQGKSSLLKKHLHEGTDYVVFLCSYNTEPIDIYETLIRPLEILLPEELSNEKNHGLDKTGEFNTKITIPPLAESEIKLGLSREKSYKDTAIYKPVKYNYNKVQDVIEALKKNKFNKRVVLENTHYLSKDVQKRLSIDLRNFLDEGIHFIILGIWSESNRLQQYNRDLLERIAEISVEPWNKIDFEKVAKIGSDLLQIDMKGVINEIISESFGSIGVFQELCKDVYIDAKKERKENQVTITLSNLKTAIKSKSKEYESCYITSFESFSKKDKDYECIPYLFLKILLRLDINEVRKGISRDFLETEIQVEMGTTDGFNGERITRFIKSIKEYQLKNEISPPLFAYSSDSSKILITDSTLYFFLKHCDKERILGEIRP